MTERAAQEHAARVLAELEVLERERHELERALDKWWPDLSENILDLDAIYASQKQRAAAGAEEGTPRADSPNTAGAPNFYKDSHESYENDQASPQRGPAVTEVGEESSENLSEKHNSSSAMENEFSHLSLTDSAGDATERAASAMSMKSKKGAKALEPIDINRANLGGVSGEPSSTSSEMPKDLNHPMLKKKSSFFNGFKKRGAIRGKDFTGKSDKLEDLEFGGHESEWELFAIEAYPDVESRNKALVRPLPALAIKYSLTNLP